MFLLAVLFLSLSPISAKAALPGQVLLKNGYQYFSFSLKSPEIWGEFDKFYFNDTELLLTPEELQQIPEDKLEIRKVRGVNRAYLYRFLEEKVRPEVNKDGIPANVIFKDGRAEFSNHYEMQQELNVELSAKALERAIVDGVDEVELVVMRSIDNLKISPELQSEGVNELVSVGFSDFSGSSAARKHNIKTAIARYEGLILKEGEVFSFNDNLGEVTRESGYKKELVIKGDETIPEFGGGVCQVSSTVYRSAMLAGLPILERKGHSYSVSYYYPSGSDATIYPGVQDLKFQNNTGKSIMIYPKMNEDHLYIYIFGTKNTNNVNIYGPFVTNVKPAPPNRFLPSTTLPKGKRVLTGNAVQGLTSTWYRQISSEKERIISTYQARPRTYKVGGLKEIFSGNFEEVLFSLLEEKL